MIKTGKGLFHQLDEGNKRPYKPLTEAGLWTSMHEVFVVPPVREDLLKMLKEKQITQAEYDGLLRMVNSPDRESFVLAEEIMQIKKPTQDDTIYSRRSQV